jgi:exonuclease III
VKVATYNVNGVNGRLEILLRWLKEASPDVVCLQELMAPQEKFPIKPSRQPAMRNLRTTSLQPIEDG